MLAKRSGGHEHPEPSISDDSVRLSARRSWRPVAIFVAVLGGDPRALARRHRPQHTCRRGAWAFEQRGLARRRGARFGLPLQSDSALHIHVCRHLFVDGRRVPVPAGIGIDRRARFIASLHTHDVSGIVHVESERTTASSSASVRAWFPTVVPVRFASGL